jgi:hypothetical protein
MARLLLIAASAALLASTSATAAVLVVRSSGPSAAAYPPEASWPADMAVKTGKRISVSGLAQPTTLTLRQLSPIPSGLEGMAQSLIRADCQAQLNVLVDTFSARSEG